MQHVKHNADYHPSHPMPFKMIRLALACASALFVMGCGNPAEGDATDRGSQPKAAAVTSSATVKESLMETPCALAPTETVAATFNVPAAEIERSELSSMCEYRWKDDARSVSVTLYIQRIAEDARGAASYFNDVTRGMSGADVAGAFDEIAAQVGKDKDALDTPEKPKAAEMLVDSGKSGSSQGIQFEDVAGLADQARFNVGTGELNVRQGNLVFSLNAYAGDEMTMPDEFSAAALQQASKDWIRNTVPQRRQAATKLAEEIIRQL